MTKAWTSVLMESVSTDRLARNVSSLPLLHSGNKSYTCVITGGREHTVSAKPGGHTSCYYLRQRSRYMRLPAFVCLSVCLLTRLLKNACMDLDEIFHVDRCRDTDELINFWARSGWQSGSRSRIYTGFLNFSGIFVKVINGFRWNFMGR